MAEKWLRTCLLIVCIANDKPVRADGPLAPNETIAAMRVMDGLEAKVFAAEPMITNPTNITVDARGRVWVCDVVNYRGNQGKRPEGDRILVLEDTDGDGRADKSTVFYQGHDVDSALGICVLGEKVIVSCSPDVFVLTDNDGDGRADDKQLLYTNTGDKQHDHSAHAFVFGPDGCLYWNIGNFLKGVFDPDGKAVVDILGHQVLNNGKPYQQGMAFRQNLDGGELEVLAHNLRNSYELTVDAFGDVWFTDNDDDGNRGTRFCFTLDGGNYGYTDELTGQGWRNSQRIGSSSEIPIRHWHQNDPGSIPNVLNNGSGSPSGVEVYEANLLPERIRGGIIHCEPGHNVVRVYLPQVAGAGYSAETIELIDGRQDPWFRPVDVATAPDGSLLIADWYDPGVGGHRQADIDRGRIYRLAPRDAAYRAEKLDFKNATQACRALCSGNNSTRYAAWMALRQMGSSAESALEELSLSDDPRQRARAYWLLTRMPDSGDQHLKRAAEDSDGRVRAAATRMIANFSTSTAEQKLSTLADDPSPIVRRAVAIALRKYHDEDFAPRLWAKLATQFDGQDRWYLEALGLAAELNWDGCINAWLDLAGDDAWRTPAGRMVIWRSRGTETTERLVDLLADPTTPAAELPKLLRALDFNSAENLDALMIDLTESVLSQPAERRWLVGREALRRVNAAAHSNDRIIRIVTKLLQNRPRDAEFAELVMQFRLTEHYEDLFDVAIGPLADQDRGVQLIRFLVRENHLDRIRQTLSASRDDSAILTRMLANTGETRAFELLVPLVQDAAVAIDTRREAIRALSTNKNQANKLVTLAEVGDLAEPMQIALVYALRTSPWQGLSHRMEALHPELTKDETEQLPVVAWMKLRGKADRGQAIFAGKANCATCHRVGETGKDIGPALTEIGSKLSRTGLYESILYPSAAISHNYESYVALTDEGTAVKGVLVSETDTTVTLKTEKAVLRELRRDELEDFQKMTTSLMPDGLHKLITPQEMADLVAYLSQLKRKSLDN